MYHRFNENKYPSTNIKMNIFDEQMQTIKNLEYDFYDPRLFVEEFDKIKEKKKILITIDDGFQSFYEEAWPYLKKIISHLSYSYQQSLLVKMVICLGNKF